MSTQVSEITLKRSAQDQLPLSIRDQLAGKHILLTGVTGFVGKVLLTMIGAHLKGVRKVSVLIRSNKNYSDAQARFDEQVIPSEPFKAIARTDQAFEEWMRTHVYPITGDVTQDKLGLSDSDYLHLTQEDPLDLIIHCAGNVNFDPPLNEALEVNTLGVAHKLELARDAGCPLVHMSTCFVAGEKSGRIKEDPNLINYTPKSVEGFDAEREVNEAVDAIQRWQREALCQASQERFRQDAIDSLKQKGLDPEHQGHLKQEQQAKLKSWLNQKLKQEGMERAKRWGWTNTYTYSKSLGEQLTLKRARDYGVDVAIVRPAIVESAASFPFPGWNEGINTCAPIVYLYWKGQRFCPSNPDNLLDVIPVDWVCHGTLLASAELLEGQNRHVYQCSTSAMNPLTMRRAIELTNLAWRRRYDQDFSFFHRHLMRNLDTLSVSPEVYQKMGAPAVRKATRGIQSLIKALPKPISKAIQPATKTLSSLEKATQIADTIFEIFAPFILENNPCFEAEHCTIAANRLNPEERSLFGFPIAELDWRNYWMNIHMEGLQKWVFGELDQKLAKERFKPRATDLVALLHRACEQFKHQRALQLFGVDGLEVTYTYGDLWKSALSVAGALKAQGLTQGDRILLMSPNEPAWPMCYLGGLLADATIVPVDPDMSPIEVGNIIRKANARVVISHEDYPQNLDDLGCVAWNEARSAEGKPLLLMSLGDCLSADPMPEESVSLRDRSQELASLLFTSGTTGDPKGVMLTHENFCALLSGLQGVFKVDHRDRFLSVLPLFHTFEFSGGFLLPMSVGARITYLSELEGPTLRAAMKEIKPTGIIGIPALWDILQKRVESQVKDRGEAAKILFKIGVKFNRELRNKGLNLGPILFSEVHANLGGKIRYLISGGAALSDTTLEIFEGLGFELLEGYGLTEAAPVLAVRRPKSKRGSGTVGRPLPGVQIKIKNPDSEGVGEVLARGDNVMMGYLDNPEATESTLQDGWLHTGDLGSLNHRGELSLAGRSKELIVTSSGKNVYPDELEPIFADHEYIDEISIVGIPDPQGDERVAALIVLTQDAPQEAQQEVKAHIATINALRADHQRLRTYRFWPEALPRTATRKVRRAEVREQLMRLLEVNRASRKAEREAKSMYEPAWLYAALAGLCDVSINTLTPDRDLTSDLGLSSLQFVELRTLMEDGLQHPIDGTQLIQAQKISDLVALTESHRQVLDTQEGPSEDGISLWKDLPEPAKRVGQRVIDLSRSLAFNQLFKLDIKGQANIPLNQQVIVIANHSSHLDIGLIKEALGPLGDELAVLAAQDYFFDHEYKEALFTQLTHLIPLDRSAPLEKSMKGAEEAIAQGRSVLLYPEGTRSTTGELMPFKAGVGYLQQRTKLPVLPLFLSGTHKAMPKGGGLPRFGRRLSARIGRLIEVEHFNARCEGKRRHEIYQEATDICYEAIVALRDGRLYPWERENDAPIEESSGVEPLMTYLNDRFAPEKVSVPITWYFSLGEASDCKWTLSVNSEQVQYYPGKPNHGQADCVLKTDLRTFERIIKEGYVPGFAEFASGKIKTNNPQHLYSLQSVFSL